MSGESKNSKLKNSIKFYLKSDIIKVVLVILCLLVLMIGITSLVKSGVEENVTLVLSFFGILATFIVISNYSQISDIKNDTYRQIIQQNLRIEERGKEISLELQRKIDDISKKITDVKSETDTINETLTTNSGEPLIILLRNQFEELKKQNDKLSNENNVTKQRNDELEYLIVYLLFGDHRELLMNILQGYTCNCRVTCGGKVYRANASIFDNHVCFDIDNFPKTTDVKSLNGKPYNKNLMDKLLEIYTTQKIPY